MHSQEEHEYLQEAGYFSLASGFRNKDKLITPTPERPTRRPYNHDNIFCNNNFRSVQEILSQVSCQDKSKQQQQPQQPQYMPAQQPRQQQQQQLQQFEVPEVPQQNVKQQNPNSIQGCGIQIDAKWLAFKPEKKKALKNVHKVAHRQQNMNVDTTNCRYDRVKPQIDNFTNPSQFFDQGHDDQDVIFQQEEPMCLFDQLLKLAPQPVEIKYIQTLNTLGPHSQCLGEVNGQQIEYIRRQNVQGYIYPEYRIQLD